MKLLKLILACSLSAAATLLQAQPVIDKNDMPNIGDTIRISQASVPQGINYQAGGNNQTWNFAGMQPVLQRVDTFMSVLSTSLFYYPSFLLSASIAANGSDLANIPGVTLTDVYEFFKESNNNFTLVGYGATYNGIPFTPKFNPPDLVYTFPLTVGQTDTNESILSLEIPNVFSFKQTKSRINTVDGWGTLTTPYGTFQTVRMKSQVVEIDSLYLDTLGVYLPLLPRFYTEYKWLADNRGLPVLYINKPQLGNPTAFYIDSVRVFGQSIDKSLLHPEGLNIFPNPAFDAFVVQFPDGHNWKELSISEISGRLIHQSQIESGQGEATVNVPGSGLTSGTYIVELSDGIARVRSKVLISRTR